MTHPSSFRPSGCTTGMTRFACLWVEQSKPVALVNVMCFDEGLNREHEHILDTGGYEQYSDASTPFRQAPVNDFTFTL